MTTVNVNEIVIVSFGLVAIWYLYFWLYKDYAIDCFRQNVFELRDKLFDEASMGLVDFNHPAYCLLRRTMNGTIRYSHKISFVQMVFVSFLFKKQELESHNVSFEKKFENAISNLEDEAKERLSEYRKELINITFHHIIRESPIAFFFIVLILIFLSIPIGLTAACCSKIVSTIKSFYYSGVDSMESTALAVGKL